MKVLHFLNSNTFSGAENVVCQIIYMMRTVEGMQMVYCSPDGPIRDQLAEREISYEPLRALSVSEVRRVLQKLKPDIVHAHDMRASFVCAVVCGQIPLISHIHNNAFESRSITAKSVIYLYAAWRAKHIFWVTDSAMQEYRFRGLVHKKSDVLANIIDVNALYSKMRQDASSYEYDVVYVGRLTEPKNPLRLMRVAAKVISEKPDTRFAIVGNGDLEFETKSLAESLNLGNQVDFLGFRDNPLKIMYDAKVLVMTSLYEGVPMCALEAMALGVPVVGTAVDGLRKIIQNGENGYLMETDEEIAERIHAIVSDAKLRENLSKNAKEYAQKINNIDLYRAKILNAYGAEQEKFRMDTVEQ